MSVKLSLMEFQLPESERKYSSAARGWNLKSNLSWEETGGKYKAALSDLI